MVGGLCCGMSSQVDNGFDEDVLDLEINEAVIGKRKFKDVGDHVGGQIAKRQRAWIRRSEGSKDCMEWRPLNLHRTSARKYLVSLDHQIQMRTVRSGLQFFQFNESDALWKDWRLWPMVNLANDM